MAHVITDDCINCGACEIMCPVQAVYPKTESPEMYEPLFINNIVRYNGFASAVHFYINPYECNSCKGLSGQTVCNTVCPVSCCLPHEDYNIFTTRIMLPKNVSITKISLN